MPTPLPKLGVFVMFLVALPVAVSAAVRGYVERPWTPTFCLQESHFLTDPCSGALMMLDDRGAIDLDPYVCRHVVVDGPDVGVECQVISSQTVIVSQPTCPITFQELWLSDENPPRVNWMHITCAATHDVIRGDLARVLVAASRIDLGAVRCLANDVPQADWWYVSGPADADAPPAGEAFFYLARAAGLPFGDLTYGHASAGQERVPASDDCPF